MKDIPIFTCADGMASLLLREIPTRREAYVSVRAVFGTLEGLLRECAAFCRAAGAATVYCGGNAGFSGYPVYARLIERTLPREALPDTAARAVATAAPEWAALYNESFSAVPAAKSYLHTPESGAYFLYDGKTRIGLGLLQNGTLAAVAALRHGRGADCVCALAAELREPAVRLVCAEENLPAMRLYDRLGFSCGAVREVWYCMK